MLQVKPMISRSLKFATSRKTLLCTLFFLSSLFHAVFALEAAEQKIVFSRDILPILSDKCFKCHGPDAKAGREGDLRLDIETDVKKDRDGYQVVKSGDAKASELYKRVSTKDEDLHMPPVDSGLALSESQIQKLKNWINQGAPWGKHWAFERIERPALTIEDLAILKNSGEFVNPVPPYRPDSKHIEKILSPHAIDILVQRVLNKEKITPNSIASKETLIRRLKLDLTGLPPTPEQVKDFLADKSPDAWEKLIDKTLAEKAFGERMAWDWLEIARYADSNGYQNDSENTMWPWRDWVVKAYNNNLPFDQFTTWQLAGDLLDDATNEQILATGFNRNHMINGEGGRIPEENRVEYVMDMTETMGTAWLGLTLNCCRCHDHKFDPLTNEDYYSFTAFFNQTPVTGGGRNPQTPPVLEVPSASQLKKLEFANAKITDLEQKIKSTIVSMKTNQAAWEKTLGEEYAPTSWVPLKFNLMESEQGEKLSQDHSDTILVEGKHPDNDNYTLTANAREQNAPIKHLSAIWLEAVQHKSMTQQGYAHSNSGNFVLTEFEIYWRSKDTKWKQLQFGSATATFEQGNFKVTSAYDGNTNSGWAVYNGKAFTRNHWAVFKLKESVALPEDAELKFVLKHQSKNIKHNLGHFRILVTSEKSAKFPNEKTALRIALQIPAEKRSTLQRQQVDSFFTENEPELKKLRKELGNLKKNIPKIKGAFPKVMVMQDKKDPRKTYILDRGLYNAKKEEVTASFPAFLHAENAPESAKTNRLALANWLVSRENPLTARVVVNRYWQMLFGIGLVKTPEDFGVQGEYPIQRELLDWLAAEYMENGWDTKKLLKTILLSETYRRSSVISNSGVYERDPQNRFLARGPRFRMPAWMIRDQALMSSGLINR